MTTASDPHIPPTPADTAATASPTASPETGPAPNPAAVGRRLSIVADQTPDSPAPAGCDSSSPGTDVPGEASRARKSAPAKAGADLCGEVLLTLAQLRLATPRQLKALLLPHQQDTDHVRRALRNLLAESPALVGRTHRAQQSYWYCTAAGLAEAAASGELAPMTGRTTGKRIAASKTGLREHGLALVDTVIAFHRAEVADHADWRGGSRPPHPGREPRARRRGAAGRRLQRVRGDRPHHVLRPPARPAGALRRLPQRTCVRAWQRRPRPTLHWQETYAGPPLDRPFPPMLFVFAPAPRRAAPDTREAAFHDRARPNWRITVATTTLHRLTRDGADRPVWRVVGHGEDRWALTALPKPR
nr:replication-relaxation family protein [Streptomyces typhae]